MSEVVVTATRVRNIGIVGDQTAPKSRITLTGEYISQRRPPGRHAVPEPQPDSGRQLHQHRSVRHLGRQPAHSRLRRLARVGHLRRHSAQRLRQLRAVHEPDARSGAHRSRRREPRHHRRRQPDGLGHRRHGRVSHAQAPRGVRRPGDRSSGGNFDYKRAFLRVDTGEWGDLGTTAFFAASYQNYDKFKGPGELEKKQFNAVFRQDFDNEQLREPGVPLQRESQRVLPHREHRELRRRTAATTTTSTRARATLRPPAVRDNENCAPVRRAATPALPATDNLANTVELHELLRRAHQSVGYRQRPHAVAVAPRRQA